MTGNPPAQTVHITVNGTVHAETVGIRNDHRARPRAADLFRPAHPQRRHEPSALLDPMTGVLPLHRRAELDGLLAWCDDPNAPVGRLLCGAGGQGKTTLARQLVAAVGEGRQAGFVRLPADPADAEAILAAAGALRSALLVVDYAEGHFGFVRRLLAAVPGSARVLVVTRAVPEWWRTLVDRSPGLVAAQPTALGPLPGSLGGDAAAATARLWRDAVARLAADLDVPAPRADPPERFATTLDLYAHALLTVLGRTADDPLRGILQHEHRVLAHAVASWGAEHSLDRDLAVSAVFLRPARSTADAAGLLGSAPRLRHLAPETLRAVVDALIGIYPADAGDRVWAAPRPDRLADTHLLHTAEQCPSDADWGEHVAAVCGTDDPAAAEHAATVLVRALSTPGERYPRGLRRLTESIVDLLRRHPAAYLPPLVRLAPGRFGAALAGQLARPDLPAAAVAAVDRELRSGGVPAGAHALAVSVSRRLLEAADDPAEQAGHLLTLGGRLADAGDLDAALEVAEEAVAAYRALPDPVGLAAALTALSHRCAEHGLPDEALETAVEAAGLRRSGSRTELGYALHNVAMCLVAVDRWAAAEAPAREAVAVLTAEHERAGAAAALTGLAQVLAGLGRTAAAAAAARRAVEQQRPLAAAHPRHRPALGRALIAWSRHLAPLTEKPRRTAAARRAVTAATEAAALFAELAKADPAYRAAHADSLVNLGLRLAAANRARAGREQVEAALPVLTELCEESATHQAGLLAAVNDLALLCEAVGDLPAAREHARAAVEVARSMVDGRPGTRRALAATLVNAGFIADRAEEAAATTAEAVALHRALLAERPSVEHRIDLADALLNLGRLQHAETPVAEAIDLYGEVEPTHADLVHDRFRAALTAQAHLIAGELPPERYCRRWHEVLVRMPLPGIAILTPWWTTLATRHPRDRTTGHDLLAATDRSGGVGRFAARQRERMGTGANRGGGAVFRLVARQRDRAGTAGDRGGGWVPRPGLGLAVLPRRWAAQVAERGRAVASAVEPVVAQVQGNPAAVAKLAGVLAAVVALLAGAAAVPPPVGAPPRAASGGPGITTTPPSVSEGGTSAPPPSAATPPPAAPPPQVATTGLSAAGHTPAEDVPPGGAAPTAPAPPSPTPPGPTPPGPTPPGPTPTGPTPPRSTPPSPTPPSTPQTEPPRRGFPVSVDFSALSYSSLLLDGRAAPRSRWSAELAAGEHELAVPDGPRLRFTVTATGTVDYDPAHDAVLSGRSGTGIVLRGHAVAVDGTAGRFPGLAVDGVAPVHLAALRLDLRLLPGDHRLRPERGPVLPFTVGGDGLVDYSRELDALLAGRGTRTLVVRGDEPPARWAYTRVDPGWVALGRESALPAEGQWGTWLRPGPTRVDRLATAAHPSPGEFVVRFPESAAAQGIAHVTVTSTALTTAVCTVRGERPDGTDQLVEISCRTSKGVPADAAFGVIFAEAKAGGAAAVAVRYEPGDEWAFDSTGHPVGTRRLGVGEYEVDIAGPAFHATGHAQVTPRGDGRARCRAEVSGGAGVAVRVRCHAADSARPVDSGWNLTYLQNAPIALAPAGVGAYVRTTGTGSGLVIDRARSHNPVGGAMTIQRRSRGEYVVGVRGIAASADHVQVAVADALPGYCHSGYWYSGQFARGELWAHVRCATPEGVPADLNFALATARKPWMPGETTGPLHDVVPGPHPPGPKWGYVRVTDAPLAPGVWTQTHPDWQWSTWVDQRSRAEARWARKAAVEHPATGRYRVRLPGLASSTGIAHASAFYDATLACSVPGSASDGVDQIVEVVCHDRAGVLRDAFFALSFAEAQPGGPPALAIRHGTGADLAVNTTGGGVVVTRDGPGRFTITADGPFTGLGHTAITAGDTGRCAVASTDADAARLTLRVECTGDAWQLTHVQGVGLHHDPGATAAHAAVRADGAPDPARSFSTTGEQPTATRTDVGRYTITYTDIGNPAVYPGDTVQTTTYGPVTRYCATTSWNSYSTARRLTVTVECRDQAGRFADTGFSVAYLRAPWPMS
ncbi:hypothetical protein [Actinokineospora sp. NPDC004072]